MLVVGVDGRSTGWIAVALTNGLFAGASRFPSIRALLSAIPDADTFPYLSPKDLAERWRCSRPTVGRIAERAGFSRFYLGEGRNGVVRYLRKEVEAYEESRRVQG